MILTRFQTTAFNKFVLFLYFLLSLIINQKSFAQSKLDSLRNIWENDKIILDVRFSAINSFYELNTFNDPMSSLKLSKLHYQLAKQKNNFKQLIKANNEKAIVYAILAKPDSALFYIEEAIHIAEQLKDSVQIAKLYINQGSALRDLGQFKNAVRRYFEGLYILEKLNKEPLNQADANNNIGLIYFDLGLYEIARPYFEKALHIYKQIKGSKAIGNVWLNLCGIYYELGQFEKAKSSVQLSIEMLEEEGNTHSLSTAYLVAASYLEKDNQLDSALILLNKAIDLRNVFGNTNLILEALIFKLNFDLTHNISISKEDKDKVIKLMDTISELKIKASGFLLLHKLYKLEGNIVLALEMLENYTKSSDSLSVERDKYSVIREEIQSDYDNKLLQHQLESERQKAAEDLRYIKNIFILSIISLICILIIVWVVRKKLLSNSIEKANLLKEIENLKRKGEINLSNQIGNFELIREKLELFIGKKLNETDWSVLNVLVENPAISNKELAEKVFLSNDGVGSSLRRMYLMFDVPESKYMKIALLLKAIKISNSE
jgi:tetratricopeptide (TPR) repeat protein